MSERGTVRFRDSFFKENLGDHVMPQIQMSSNRWYNISIFQAKFIY